MPTPSTDDEEQTESDRRDRDRPAHRSDGAIMADGGRDGRLPAVLGPFAAELEEAAESADDPEERDSCEALGARARGEPVPPDVARRILDRAEE